MSDKETLKPVIEAIIFAADSPVSFEKLVNVLEGEERDTIRAALNELVEDFRGSGRGFFIDEVAGGFQFRTSPEFSPWLRKLFKIGMQKVSKAAMESLAIIAYKQPLTRGEIEAIRGVDSGGVLATLMEKRFIKIVGRKEAPGRPVVYGTTKEFLEMFDLKDLSCLPSLKDIQKMEEENGPQEKVQPQENETSGEAGTPEGGPAPAKSPFEEKAPGHGGETRQGGDGGGTASEDNSEGRDNIEEEGGGDDPPGPGYGKQEDGDGAGGKG